MAGSYVYIDPSELVALLDDATRRPTVAVVDCRDDDRGDGFIVGSIHFPSAAQSSSRFADLAAALRAEGKRIAVFHCALSQVRGPRAAGRFAAVLRERGAETGTETPVVCVLRGGWENFYATYGESRPDLISL